MPPGIPHWATYAFILLAGIYIVTDVTQPPEVEAIRRRPIATR
jgi:hypothetical protein